MKGRERENSLADNATSARKDVRERARLCRRSATAPELATYRMLPERPPDDITRLLSQLDRLRWHVESVAEALIDGHAWESPAWLQPEFRQGSNRDIARQLVAAHEECAYVQWSKERLAAVTVRWRANLRYMFETGRKILPEYGTVGALRLVEAMGPPIDRVLMKTAERLMCSVLVRSAHHGEQVSPWQAAVELTQALITVRYTCIANDFAKQGADKVAREKPDGPDPEFRDVIWMICETLKEEASRRKANNPGADKTAPRARKKTHQRRGKP